MAGLIDIAPAAEQISVRGVSLDITGVSAKGIAMLLGRFPELRKMMGGVEVKMEKLMDLGGDVVAPIIAAGTGAPGDADAEAAASRLTISEQAEILEVVMRLTFPQGVGPFVERLVGLSGSLGGGAPSVTVPGTK